MQPRQALEMSQFNVSSIKMGSRKFVFLIKSFQNQLTMHLLGIFAVLVKHMYNQVDTKVYQRCFQSLLQFFYNCVQHSFLLIDNCLIPSDNHNLIGTNLVFKNFFIFLLLHHFNPTSALWYTAVRKIHT